MSAISAGARRQLTGTVTAPALLAPNSSSKNGDRVLPEIGDAIAGRHARRHEGGADLVGPAVEVGERQPLAPRP